MSKPIDDALNTTSEHSYVQKFNSHKEVPVKKDMGIDIDKDYEYSRAQLYSLIEKGQETLNGIMEVAGESGSPRAFEVAGQVLKSTADIADKLIEEINSLFTNFVLISSLFMLNTDLYFK